MNVLIATAVTLRDQKEIEEDVETAIFNLPKIFPDKNITPICMDYQECMTTVDELNALKRSTQFLPTADAVYFCPEWNADRYCHTLYLICEMYAIQRIVT